MCGDCRRFHFLVDLRKMGCRSDYRLPDRTGVKIWCYASLTFMSRRRHGTNDQMSMCKSAKCIRAKNSAARIRSPGNGIGRPRGGWSVIIHKAKVAVAQACFAVSRCQGNAGLQTFLLLRRPIYKSTAQSVSVQKGI